MAARKRIAFGLVALSALTSIASCAQPERPPLPAPSVPKSIEVNLAAQLDSAELSYETAKAKASGGAMQETKTALEAAFAANFVGMRARAEADVAFAKFWQTPSGAELRAQFPTYVAREETLLRRGVPALLYDNVEAPADKPRGIRIGVFDPQTWRFVAVAPKVSGARFGYASARLGYAAVTTESETTFYPLTSAGRPMAKLSTTSEGVLLLGREGARFEQTDFRSEVVLTTVRTLKFGSAEQVAKYKGVVKPTAADDYVAHVELDVGNIEEPSASYTYADARLTLPSGEVLDLLPKHDVPTQATSRITPSPKGDRVLLVWNVGPTSGLCGFGGVRYDTLPPERKAALDRERARGTPGAYNMALVSVKDRRITMLGKGDGTGFAAFSPESALYIQQGTQVFPVDNQGYKGRYKGRPWPKGVLLAPPTQPRTGDSL
jgi:hypothetical protein